jgi:hypothetical protein
MTFPTHSTQNVVTELINHTQAFGEVLVVREQVEAALERLKASGQILNYAIKLPNSRTLEALLTVPFEVYRDLSRVAALTEPLDALSTDAVTVLPYATFPDLLPLERR